MWEKKKPNTTGGKISLEEVKTKIYNMDYQISDTEDKHWRFSQDSREKYHEDEMSRKGISIDHQSYILNIWYG